MVTDEVLMTGYHFTDGPITCQHDLRGYPRR
jgi:hypothetical protein